MVGQDVALAEALWTRAKQFAQDKKYYDALLDIGAAFRLLSINCDPRTGEVHQQWQILYETYRNSQKAEAAQSSENVSQLESLLKQLVERRRT